MIEYRPHFNNYDISTKGFTLNIVLKWNQTSEIKGVCHMDKELWFFRTDKMVVKRTRFLELNTLHNLEK